MYLIVTRVKIPKMKHHQVLMLNCIWCCTGAFCLESKRSTWYQYYFNMAVLNFAFLCNLLFRVLLCYQRNQLNTKKVFPGMLLLLLFPLVVDNILLLRLFLLGGASAEGIEEQDGYKVYIFLTIIVLHIIF